MLEFDNLYLSQYKIDISEDSQNVTLFAPINSKERYFADFGWVSSDTNIELPGSGTIWQSDSGVLSPSSPIVLSWKNKQNIQFFINIKFQLRRKRS